MADATGADAPTKEPVIGLALGSGSARGWAHIGVIQQLEELGIHPQIVAGTSIGALVGAVYVSGQLDEFTDWVKKLTARDVFGLLDLKFTGGMVKGERLFGLFMEQHKNPVIERLEQKFISVATEMRTGRESWIARGPILSAARASCAMPGLFSPVQHDERWMLDGGLVNPVPVSAARAYGAEVVIAVNLNVQLIGTHLSRASRSQAESETETATAEEKSIWQKVADYFTAGEGQPPSFFDVIASSVNIMQDRITRSRMAGDPPEITLVPLLPDFAFMDFHRAAEAIEEGRRLVQRNAEDILARVGRDPSKVASEAGPGAAGV